MSLPTDDADESGAPEPAEAPELDPDPVPVDARSVISLIPHDGVEPPAGLTDETAGAILTAVSAPWHPAVLAALGTLPRVEGVETPSAPAPREVRLAAAGQSDRLPSGYRTQVEDSGAVLVEGTTDRDSVVVSL